MEVAIFILAGLAAYHFIYEGILAPSIRLKLRFDLFELRDRLRELKMENGDLMRDQHFHHLQDSINSLLHSLYRFDFATLSLAEHQSRHDPEFRKRVEDRVKALDDCDFAPALKIRRKSLVIAAKALAVNSGACALYLLPVALVYFGYSQIKRQIKIVASLSDNDLKRVSIDDDEEALCPS